MLICISLYKFITIINYEISISFLFKNEEISRSKISNKLILHKILILLLFVKSIRNKYGKKYSKCSSIRMRIILKFRAKEVAYYKLAYYVAMSHLYHVSLKVLERSTTRLRRKSRLSHI